MNLDFAALALPFATLATLGLTGAVLRVAHTRAWLDVPNDRSLHSIPTPRGGGLGIVATMLGFLLIGGALRVVPPRLVAALWGGIVATALVGYIDDRRGVHPLARAAVHLAAGAWVVAWLGGLSVVHVGGRTLTLGWFGSVLATVLIAWCVNLYNFMDGIDGIAGSEAVIVGLVSGILFQATGARDLAWLALLTAASSAGFLAWNWPPARIFMGDVGSGSLGLIFGTLAVSAEITSSVPMLIVLLLLGVFIVDATITLLRRMARGERWYQAHCSHAYQRLVQTGWSHRRVTTAVILVDLGLALVAGWGLWAGSVAIAALIGLVTLVLLFVAVESAQPLKQ